MAQKIYPLMVNPEDTDENPLTHQRLMNWLADTGYVEGFFYKKLSPLDLPYADDYLQEVWVQILKVPPERIMYMWYKGKGAFVNYIKAIITNNIVSSNSPVYNAVRGGTKELVHLDDAGWNHLDNDEEADAYLQYAIWEKQINPETGRLKSMPTINYEKITVKSDGHYT